MASFVLLIKEVEDADIVVYRFGPTEEIMGRIEFNKNTRNFREIEPVPDPNQSSQFYFDRAAQRLARCFLKEGGQFPDKTVFAS